MIISIFNCFFSSLSCTEASKCSFSDSTSPAHDSFTRLLERQPPDTDALWEEVKNLVTLEISLLLSMIQLSISHMLNTWTSIIGNGAVNIDQIVNGINLETIVWTNYESIIPIDFRIYDINTDGKTKNDHFLDMLNVAEERGFSPEFVLFDTWYSSLENLKTIRKKGWHWLTRLKKNRLVNPDNTGNIAIELVTIPPEGMKVHLKGLRFY